MFPRSDVKPETSGFGRRISLPAGIRSFSNFRPALRLAALWEAFLVAVSSLRQNKLRTGLTLIGIIVGVTAVIAVVTIIKGLDQTVASTFSSQGSTVFTISKRPQVITSREDFIKFNKRKDVIREDAEAIFRSCTVCWRTGIAANSFEIAKHGDQKFEGVRVRAIAPAAMFDIDGVSIDVGRLWTESESAAAREVCVVGPDIVTNLFPDVPLDRAIGQDIWTGGHRYTIIGVLQPLGKIFGASRDNVIYIPYANFEKNFGAHNSLVVFVQTETKAQLEQAEDQARAVMRNRRGKNFRDEDDGFALETQDVFLNLYSSATSNIYVVTIGVSAISLVVGGIVVMNIMLVSVTERTKEIGIRKAVGARRKDILTQFLIEAVTVTAIGGVLGVLSGFGVAWLIALLIGFPLLFSVWSAVLGVSMSSIVGVISGLWPAWRAAKLDPIEALRSE
ncbi:MAG: putative transport system permease protein [Blastocatellia bacterium]|jgi:putative ABC transport system permease protein|nr:putative transport system permease protein [Blastocatellia bacterium]